MRRNNLNNLCQNISLKNLIILKGEGQTLSSDFNVHVFQATIENCLGLDPWDLDLMDLGQLVLDPFTMLISQSITNIKTIIIDNLKFCIYS